MFLTRMYRKLMKIANVDGSPSTWATAQAQRIVEILSSILKHNLNKMQLESINH